MLPTSEDTRANLKNFVTHEDRDHIVVPFAAGCLAGDMIVVVPWCGIADHTVVAAVGAEVSIDVKEGRNVRTAAVEAGAVFDTVGQEVWYNLVTGEFTDTEDAGLYLVGYLTEPEDADGVIGYEKRRYVETGVGT